MRTFALILLLSFATCVFSQAAAAEPKTCPYSLQFGIKPEAKYEYKGTICKTLTDTCCDKEDLELKHEKITGSILEINGSLWSYGQVPAALAQLLDNLDLKNAGCSSARLLQAVNTKPTKPLVLDWTTLGKENATCRTAIEEFLTAYNKMAAYAKSFPALINKCMSDVVVFSSELLCASCDPKNEQAFLSASRRTQAAPVVTKTATATSALVKPETVTGLVESCVGLAWFEDTLLKPVLVALAKWVGLAAVDTGYLAQVSVALTTNLTSADWKKCATAETRRILQSVDAGKAKVWAKTAMGSKKPSLNKEKAKTAECWNAWVQTLTDWSVYVGPERREGMKNMFGILRKAHETLGTTKVKDMWNSFKGSKPNFDDSWKRVLQGAPTTKKYLKVSQDGGIDVESYKNTFPKVVPAPTKGQVTPKSSNLISVFGALTSLLYFMF